MNSSPATSAASPPTSSRPGVPARLVLVGVRGFGEVHATNISRLADQGQVELVAAVDPGVVLDPPSIYGADLYADLAEALAVVGPVDVVVIAAPIGAHFRLAEIALTHGADVLLEKPPVASLADFGRLLDTEQRTGRVVQVGFQSLGSGGLKLFESGAVDIGRVLRVGAVGVWSRTVGYWSRSPWAGRRSLGGQAVVDGVVTNPLAHAVATALAVEGCRRLTDVASVETDLYRANAIDGDDTSVVRITTVDGRVITCALTLCASEQREPLVHVYGTRGRATFDYKADRIEITTGGGTHTETTARTDLLENLLAHRRDGTPLLVPLASTGAFMRVFDAVANADEPVRIGPRAIDWRGAGPDRRPVVEDVEHWVEEAASTGRTFAELEVPWAHRERDRVLARVHVGGSEVAVYRDGRGTLPTSSPRPYLHPVRTRAGVVVSAQHPADHDWHLGVGMGIPDVNGSSFWGGGTYVHEQGYVLLDNHGKVVGEPAEIGDGTLRQDLSWIGRDGSTLLREQRSIGWSALDETVLNETAWRLTFASTLHAETDAVLNSPGSKGRVGGGYGGFFWRFPDCANVEVFTPDAGGEDEVHGRVSSWIAWSADFAAGPGLGGAATVVLVARDAKAAEEPWFVRLDSYPGLGSALAWDRPVDLATGDALSRRFEIAIADGRLDRERAAVLAAHLTAVG